MDWKDTVMSGEDLIRFVYKWDTHSETEEDLNHAIAKAQAEISFKVGYEQRGKEMAEWLNREQEANLRH